MLSYAEKISFLKGTKFFSETADEYISELSAAMEMMEFTTDKNIVRIGDEGDGMYIIFSGKAKVHYKEVTVAEVGPGDVIGEMTILSPGPRTMSVTAIDDSVLGFISAPAFQTIYGDVLDASKSFVKVLIDRIKDVDNRVISEFERREKELNALVDERTHQLKEKNEQLIQTQKFKEQFLANMSHEIRTPMNAIFGMSNLLLHGASKEDQSRYHATINQSTQNLLVIINDILDFSKIEAGKLDIVEIDFNLADLINVLVNTMQFKVGAKGLKLDVNLDEKIPLLLIGDPTRLNQILLNLCGNAAKFTSEGGITIDIDLLEKTETEVRIKFTVADTGIGISEDRLTRIFESFNQAEGDTTRKFGGTGLGLTISKQLVQLMGGDISVNSKLGEGTSFYFDLRFTISKVEKLKGTEINPELKKIKDIKILLVEDDHPNQEVALKTLEILIKGVEVSIAENGQEAVDLVCADDFDLVLMDINMPVMDGYEASRQIRLLHEAKKDVKIMAVTANATKSEIEKCMEAGMNDYISKPFVPNELYSKIVSLIS